MNPLLVTLVPALMALLLYISVFAERSLKEVRVEVAIPEEEPVEPQP